MGKSNRTRRAAKVGRRRARAAERPTAEPRAARSARLGRESGSPSGRDGVDPARSRASPADTSRLLDEIHRVDEARRVAELIADGSDPMLRQHPGALRGVLDGLHTERRAVVVRELERRLTQQVALLWQNGWQPAELVRQVRRSTSPMCGRLAEMVVRVDHIGRAPSSCSPQWLEQIDELPTAVPVVERGWLSSWARAEESDDRSLVRAGLDVLATLGGCGTIEELIPPPGAARRTTAVLDIGSIADPVLERVRALLAQAESTTYEAEAAAFTAKAQELMARHSIDLALLAEAGARRGTGSPALSARRIPLDDPYADMKSLLLAVVASELRCRAVYHPRYGFTTVVGLGHDLMAAEVLFTSLLVQAQTAMAEEARSAAPGARTRSRGFRSAFLRGYANRVKARLATVNREVAHSTETAHGSSVLPVLAAQADRLDHEMERRFPGLTTSRSSAGLDAFGYRRGVAAADVARLGAGSLPPTS